MTEDTTFNGWTNYETWNVSLHIDNCETLCNLAKGCKSYQHFLTKLKRFDTYTRNRGTSDGVRWLNRKVNIAEMDEWIRDRFGLHNYTING